MCDHGCNDCEDAKADPVDRNNSAWVNQVNGLIQAQNYQLRKLSKDLSLVVFLCIAIYIFLCIGALIEQEGKHVG